MALNIIKQILGLLRAEVGEQFQEEISCRKSCFFLEGWKEDIVLGGTRDVGDERSRMSIHREDSHPGRPEGCISMGMTWKQIGVAGYSSRRVPIKAI